MFKSAIPGTLVESAIHGSLVMMEVCLADEGASSDRNLPNGHMRSEEFVCSLLMFAPRCTEKS
eukprot:1187278-Prorocentrum_minimum.AAC.4